MNSTYSAVFAEIDRLLSEHSGGGRRIVIGIDGNCGSGKTTLATAICEAYGCGSVHMDHFYLPMELRAPQRLSEPGGNVHYERFAEEVAPFLSSENAFSYRIFTPFTMSYEGFQEIPHSPLVVVEGSYSMRPEFQKLYDLKVYIEISYEEQQKRILKRNGPERLQDFIDRWIPLENKYFSYYNIKSSCDMVISTMKKM